MVNHWFFCLRHNNHTKLSKTKTKDPTAYDSSILAIESLSSFPFSVDNRNVQAYSFTGKENQDQDPKPSLYLIKSNIPKVLFGVFSLIDVFIYSILSLIGSNQWLNIFIVSSHSLSQIFNLSIGLLISLLNLFIGLLKLSIGLLILLFHLTCWISWSSCWLFIAFNSTSTNFDWFKI